MAKKKRAQSLENTQKLREYMSAHPGAKAAEITADMAAQGVAVKESSIYNIKAYDKRTGKAKPAKRKAANGAAAKSSAKANGSDSDQVMTKAAHIRDALKVLGKRSRPRDVIAHLALQGVMVASSQVVAEKNRMKKKNAQARRQAAQTAVASTTTESNALTLNNLLAAKAFADKVGGVARANELLNAIGKLS